MAQGRSSKIISMIKWIRTSKLSITDSLTHTGFGLDLRAQDRSTKIISIIKWIRTSKLSIKNSLSLHLGVVVRVSVSGFRFQV